MSYQPSHCGIAKTSTKVTAAATIPIHMPRNGESDGSSMSSSASSSSHAGSSRAGNFICASRSRRAQALERQLALVVLVVLVVFASRLVIGQHSLGLAWPPPPSGKNKNRPG